MPYILRHLRDSPRGRRVGDATLSLFGDCNSVVPDLTPLPQMRINLLPLLLKLAAFGEERFNGFALELKAR